MRKDCSNRLFQSTAIEKPPIPALDGIYLWSATPPRSTLFNPEIAPLVVTSLALTLTFIIDITPPLFRPCRTSFPACEYIYFILVASVWPISIFGFFLQFFFHASLLVCMLVSTAYTVTLLSQRRRVLFVPRAQYHMHLHVSTEHLSLYYCCLVHSRDLMSCVSLHKQVHCRS